MQKLGGEKIKEAKQFKYLGNLVSHGRRSKREIKSRVEQVKRVFLRKECVYSRLT